MSRLSLLAGPRVGFNPMDYPRSVRPLYLSAWDEGGLLQQTAGVATSWTGRQGGLVFTAAGSPTYSATGLVGMYPAVSGDGIAACLTAATTGLPTGTSPCVFLALADAGEDEGRLVDYGGTSGSNSRNLMPLNTSGEKGARVGSGALVAFGYSGVIAKPRVYAGILTATEAIMRVDGEEVARSSGTLPSASTTRARLFANTAGTAANFLAGSITELMICTELSQRQVEQFEGYCAHRYPAAGIILPDGHRYRDSSP